MSLATRCTDCGTAFRVVQDQLRVSDGWVRCGRCSAVFNAEQHLFELDASSAAPATPPDIDLGDEARPVQAQGSAGMPAAAVAAALPATAPGPAAAMPFAASVAALQAFTAPRSVHPAPTDADAPAIDAPRPVTDPPMRTDESPDVVLAIGAPAPGVETAAVRIDADETLLTPSFMRSAEPRKFWRSAGTRRSLIALAAVLTLALAAQATLAWRDLIAARVPALRPALAAMCGLLGCQVSALRRVDQLSVDASGLNPVGAALHRLSITLRNRSDTALLAPALELSLVDAQGKLLARRVLHSTELGAPTPSIGAGAELPLQALLATGNGRVSGYTVELFYP